MPDIGIDTPTFGPKGAELGATTDPTALVEGDPGAINDSAAGMQRLGFAMSQTADGLTDLTGDDWQGKAAEGFRAALQGKPAQWHTMGDAFWKCSEALYAHAHVVRQAQKDAAEAIRLWERGRKASETWARQVDDYNDAVDASNAGGPAPGTRPPAEDPGTSDSSEAQGLVASARRAVAQSGDTLTGVIRDWTGKLPDEPGVLDRIGMAVVDTADTFATQAADVYKGAFDSAKEMAALSMKVNPFTPGNLLHPQEYLESMAALGEGITKAATAAAHDPTGTATKLAESTWDTWSKGSPGRNVGALLPDVVLGMMTGGASKAATTAGKLGKAFGVDDVADAGESGRRAAAQVGRDAVDSPSGDSPFGHWLDQHVAGRDGTSGMVNSDHGSTDGLPDFGPVKPEPTGMFDDVVDRAESKADPAPTRYPWQDATPPQSEMPGGSHRPVDEQSSAGQQTTERPLAGHLGPDGTSPSEQSPAGEARHSEPSSPPGGHAPDDLTEYEDYLAGHDRVDDDPDPAQRDPDAYPHPAGDPAVQADVAHSAANKDIDLSKMPEDAVWRTDNEPLFRVGAGRGLDELFETGVTPWTDDLSNLDDFVTWNTKSGWVSTTYDEDLWMTHDIGLEDKSKFYVLEIDARGGVDVDETLGDKVLHLDEREVSMPGGVAGNRIKGAFWVEIDPVSRERTRIPGSWVDNPYYEPS